MEFFTNTNNSFSRSSLNNMSEAPTDAQWIRKRLVRGLVGFGRCLYKQHLGEYLEKKYIYMCSILHNRRMRAVCGGVEQCKHTTIEEVTRCLGERTQRSPFINQKKILRTVKGEHEKHASHFVLLSTIIHKLVMFELHNPVWCVFVVCFLEIYCHVLWTISKF
jgi:hypothetical protein